MKEIKVKLTFTEAVLGTCPGNPDIYREFIGGNAPDANTLEDEVAALGVEGVVEKGKTIFPKLDDGTPFFQGYLRRPAACQGNKIQRYQGIQEGNRQTDLRGAAHHPRLFCR